MLPQLYRLAPYIFSALPMKDQKGVIRKLVLINYQNKWAGEGQISAIDAMRDNCVPLFRSWDDLLRETKVTTKLAASLTGRKIGESVFVLELLGRLALDLKEEKVLKIERHINTPFRLYEINFKGKKQFSILIDKNGDVTLASSDGIVNTTNRLIQILQAFNYPVGFSEAEYRTLK